MSSASSLPGYLSNVLKLILILKGDEEFANLHAVTFHLQPDTNESSSHPANDSVNAPSPLPPLPSSSTSLTDLPILHFPIILPATLIPTDAILALRGFCNSSLPQQQDNNTNNDLHVSQQPSLMSTTPSDSSLTVPPPSPLNAVAIRQESSLVPYRNISPRRDIVDDGHQQEVL